jgi:uncharacterized protein
MRSVDRTERQIGRAVPRCGATIGVTVRTNTSYATTRTLFHRTLTVRGVSSVAVDGVVDDDLDRMAGWLGTARGANGGLMDLTMTSAERWTFLTEFARVCVLSVDAPERAPVSSPIWFTADDGTITFAIGPESRKAELLRRSGRATICVQSEDVPYKYVTVEGPVENIGRATEAFRRAEAVRYLGLDLADIYIAGTADEISETWVLRPERWSSTDYAKMQS